MNTENTENIIIIDYDKIIGPITQEKKDTRVSFIEEYLVIQSKILEKYYSYFPKRMNPSSNYATVIVEPSSNHKTLEAVCRNVMYFLPEHWNLIIYSYDENLVKNRLPNMEYIFYKTKKPSFSQQEYSDLLMSQEFWNSIPADNIIIFQTDSYITRRFTEDYISKISKYPFVGALYLLHLHYYNHPTKGIIPVSNNLNVCSVDYYRNYSICGGFSFRNKKAMLNCIKNINIDDIKSYRLANDYIFINEMYNEDLYFEHALYLLGYELPSEEVLLEFCVQSQYGLINTHSVHGFYKDYVNKNMVFMITPSLYEINDEIDIKINKK